MATLATGLRATALTGLDLHQLVGIEMLRTPRRRVRWRIWRFPDRPQSVSHLTHVSASPLRSRTAGFPRSGSDLGFSSTGLSAPRGNLSTGIHTPLSRRFTYQLVLLSKTGYYPVLLSGNQTPLVSEPPSAQSPFASRRRYRCEG